VRETGFPGFTFPVRPTTTSATAAPQVVTTIVEGTPQTSVVTATPAPATAEPTGAPASTRDTIIIGAWQEPESFLDHANSQTSRVEIEQVFRPHFVRTLSYDFQPNPDLVDGKLPTLANGGAKLVDVTVKAGEPIFSTADLTVISATEDTQVKQLVVTGKIKAGLKWDDGEPLTANDFVFAWKVACTPDSTAVDQTNCPFGSSPGSGGTVSKIEAPDDTTIVVSYVPGSLDPLYFTAPFGYQGAGLNLPLPEHIFGEMTPADIAADERANGGTSQVPLGWGAYKMVEWRKGESIIFEANPNWTGPRPKTPNIVYQFYSDSVAVASAVIAGDIDSASGTVGLSLDQYPYLTSVAQNGDIVLSVDKNAASFEYLTMNQNDPKDPTLKAPHPVLSDVNVRKAIAMALDRQQMVDTIFYGQSSVVEQPQLPQMVSYDLSAGTIEFNPEESKQLLEEAGWTDSDGDGVREKDGVKAAFSLLTTSGNPLRQKSTQIIQSNLKDIGIELTINYQPSSVVFSEDGIDHRLFDMAEYANVFSGVDPGSWFYGKFACNQIPTPDNGFVGNNLTGWCNDEVSNEVISAAFLTLDEQERKDAWNLVLKNFFAESYHYIPLFVRPNIVGWVPELQGLKQDSTEDFTWNIHTWTLAEVGR
jgi:peptide/nickel transport system substrate-binding protein